MIRFALTIALFLGVHFPMTSFAAEGALDLTRAHLVAPSSLSAREKRAATMLVEEIEKRTRLRLPVVETAPGDDSPAIVLARGSGKPEGYRLRADTRRVTVAGNDERGVLFGVGRLLRTLRMTRDRIELPLPLDLVSAPHYPLRGHQLGYRPKTNSYDGWDTAQWEQYYRDLAVFGANAIELIPPRSDDDADSPHFPLPPMEMMAKMSRLADDYGLAVWIWYPAMDPDYTDPKTVAAALKEWDEVFAKLPRVDAVFVPGGDPGHTPPKVLMPFLERQAASLRKRHPKAQMWVSPQGFTAVWMDEFLEILTREQPAWLTGVVFGPQVRLPLPALRKAIPARYPIRHYPDITHSKICQFPVPDWDIAHALTAGREGINPRPRDQARIFRSTQKETVGFLTYSEGCNDDVNKFVWSALGWDPDADINEVLREYGRYFIDERAGDAFAQGLLALEKNWQGPLLTNGGVETTLSQFQALERDASPQMRANWRFQQALYRAYFDAYTRRRLLYETELEQQALEGLRGATQTGALRAIDEAEAILDRATARPVAQALRSRCFALGEALFQSVRMQLSVSRYQAIAPDRGANLDTIDLPLNDRLWLKERFAALRVLPAETDRLKGIAQIVRWTDPGPGGFYDDLGDPSRRPHLLGRTDLDVDPGNFATPRTGFDRLWGRLAWSRYSETLYDTPLQMRYTGLDPDASYQVRIVYAVQAEKRKIRLVAGDGIELHPPLEKPVPIRPLEFDLPGAAIKNGTLTLTWTNEPGLGSNGRGCQVCEVWLIRK